MTIVSISIDTLGNRQFFSPCTPFSKVTNTQVSRGSHYLFNLLIRIHQL